MSKKSLALSPCPKLLFFSFLFVALVTLTSGSALAQGSNDGRWSIIGSASFSADETNPSPGAVLTQERLEAPAFSTNAGNYVFRYNVDAEDGLFKVAGAGNNTELRVRFLDPGAGARVFVVLKGLNNTTGTVTSLLTFDSDAFALGAAYQTQSATTGAAGTRINFDFTVNSYFVEVTFVKVNQSDSVGFASAQLIQN